MTLQELLDTRIAILDGAMGTMIRATHPDIIPDPLNLTQPTLVSAIHRAYVDAGADIITTNTFNSNAISTADYALDASPYELNLAGARLARAAQPMFVAGCLGPTSRVTAPFDALVDAYREQIHGLIDGGVDVLLIETVVDALSAKAALSAFAQIGRPLPVMISVARCSTTLQEFWDSIPHTGVLSLGLNCVAAGDMEEQLRELARFASIYTSCHPSANESAAEMANVLGRYASNGWLNIAGGCCGTTPEHVREIAEVLGRYVPPLRNRR